VPADVLASILPKTLKKATNLQMNLDRYWTMVKQIADSETEHPYFSSHPSLTHGKGHAPMDDVG
jgi:hypothetical protein